MKYVKSISLFFVFPLCCFILGLLIGTNMSKVPESAPIEEIASYEYEPAVVNEEYEKDNHALESAESTTDQYVMNPEVTAQMSQQDGYFITLINEYVVVYHGDMETVFLFTDIRATELPEEIKENLLIGIQIPDEGSLYDFLENYTS